MERYMYNPQWISKVLKKKSKKSVNYLLNNFV